MPPGSHLSLLLAGATLLSACALPPDGRRPPRTVRYVGPSTVAWFLRDADPVYAPLDFVLDTAPESLGGEEAIRKGEAELAGTAREPDLAMLAAGVHAALIGRDAIAVIVHADNPVPGLSLARLRDVFTGRVRNWEELGGPDLPVHPYIVGEESATRHVFRRAVLGSEDYAGCRVVRPDPAMLTTVAGDPGAIGQISFAFLAGAHHLRLAHRPAPLPALAGRGPGHRGLRGLGPERRRPAGAHAPLHRRPGGGGGIRRHRGGRPSPRLACGGDGHGAGLRRRQLVPDPSPL